MSDKKKKSSENHKQLTSANKDRLKELGLYRHGKPLKCIPVSPGGPYHGPYSIEWQQQQLAKLTGGNVLTGCVSRDYYIYFYAIEQGGALYNIFIADECLQDKSNPVGDEAALHIDKLIYGCEHGNKYRKKEAEKTKKDSKESSEESTKGLLNIFKSKTQASKNTKAKLFFGYQNGQVFFVIHPESWNPNQKRFNTFLQDGNEVLKSNIVKAAFVDSVTDSVTDFVKDRYENADKDKLFSESGKDAMKEASAESGVRLVGEGIKFAGKLAGKGHTETLISNDWNNITDNLTFAYKGWEKSVHWEEIRWFLGKNSSLSDDVGALADDIGLKDFAMDLLKDVTPISGIGTLLKIYDVYNKRFGGEELWYIGDGEYNNTLDTVGLDNIEKKLNDDKKEEKAKHNALTDTEKQYKAILKDLMGEREESAKQRGRVQGVLTAQNIFDNLKIIQTVGGNKHKAGYEEQCIIKCEDPAKIMKRKAQSEYFYLYFFGAYVYGTVYPVFIHESALGILSNQHKDIVDDISKHHHGKPVVKNFGPVQSFWQRPVETKKTNDEDIRDPRLWLNTIELSYINNKFVNDMYLEGIYLGETYGGALAQTLRCGICKATSMIYFVICPNNKTNHYRHSALKHNSNKKLVQNQKKNLGIYLQNKNFEGILKKLEEDPPEVAWKKDDSEKEKFGFFHVGKPNPKAEKNRKAGKTEDQHNIVKFARSWMIDESLDLTIIATTHKEYNEFFYTTPHLQTHEKFKNALRGMVKKKEEEIKKKGTTKVKEDFFSKEEVENYVLAGKVKGKGKDLEKEYEMMGFHDHEDWEFYV